ncbi:MAG: hypothetical protein KKB50_01595 [Planctomycetes bacterium]|nr:hypothetical protein [Planctomycetota bacterium]
MKLWKIASALALVAVWLSSGRALAQHQHGQDDQHGKTEQKEPKLPLCPVMGEPVDFNVKTMTDEGPVYFCCKACIEKYQKDPEKYAKKTEVQHVALKEIKRVQVNCPVTGEPIDGKTSIQSEGKSVKFCCQDCVAKYEKEPAKYAAKLEASYTYQTRCPVMGGEIDPAAFTDLPTGERIYFCCKGCEDKLLKSPEKCAENLAAQGINIDVKKLKPETNEKDKASQKKTGHDHDGHDHP